MNLRKSNFSNPNTYIIESDIIHFEEKQVYLQLFHDMSDDSRIGVVFINAQECYELLHFSSDCYVERLYDDNKKQRHARMGTRDGVWGYRAGAGEEDEFVTYGRLKHLPDWKQIEQVEIQLLKEYVQQLIEEGKLKV